MKRRREFCLAFLSVADRSGFRVNTTSVFLNPSGPVTRLTRRLIKGHFYNEKKSDCCGQLWKEAEGRKNISRWISVEAHLSRQAAGAESGWSAGECWLQVKLSFPVRVVCGPSTCGETAARSSAGRWVMKAKTALTHLHFRHHVSRKNSVTGPISTREEEEEVKSKRSSGAKQHRHVGLLLNIKQVP